MAEKFTKIVHLAQLPGVRFTMRFLANGIEQWVSVDSSACEFIGADFGIEVISDTDGPLTADDMQIALAEVMDRVRDVLIEKGVEYRNELTGILVSDMDI